MVVKKHPTIVLTIIAVALITGNWTVITASVITSNKGQRKETRETGSSKQVADPLQCMLGEASGV